MIAVASGAVVVALAVASMPSAGADAVPEPQPSSWFFPNHGSYVYGTDARPYATTFDPGADPKITDDVLIFEPTAGWLPIRWAPVVALFHGYGMDSQDNFAGIIGHLTRSGMTVIYPVFLDLRPGGNPVDFGDWVVQSHDAIQRALAVLESPGHVRPLRDSRGRIKLAMVAFSIGSYVAAFVADLAADSGHSLPPPRTLIMADPAGFDFEAALGIDMSQDWNLDPGTELVILSAEGTLGETNATRAVEGFLDRLAIDCDRTSAWVVPADSEQGSVLVSDHLGFQSHNPLDPTAVFDAIDWWGYWLHMSAHLKYAFHGTYAWFRHRGSIYNGLWIDPATGWPIRLVTRKYPHPSYPLGYGCGEP